MEDKEKQYNTRIKELEKLLKEKIDEISNLSNKNKSLENTVEKLKKDMLSKDGQIKELKDYLSKEKTINQNITKELKTEEEKNKELKNKLDNISLKNNENVNKVLKQIENEQQKYKILESKISELKDKEKQNINRNEELENKLKNKEKELEDVKNKIPKNLGLKFESDCKIGEYDIVLDITSFKDLVNGGWKVKYKKGGRENYLNKKKENTIIVGVIGNGNKGKSFFLEKLSGYEIPKGFNVKTE